MNGIFLGTQLSITLKCNRLHITTLNGGSYGLPFIFVIYVCVGGLLGSSFEPSLPSISEKSMNSTNLVGTSLRDVEEGGFSEGIANAPKACVSP